MRYSQRDKPPRAVFDSSFLASERSILEDRLPPRFLPREREKRAILVENGGGGGGGEIGRGQKGRRDKLSNWR